MVLIDDGRGAGGAGDAVLVSEGGAAATTHAFDGMVLLPSPDEAEPVLAAPREEHEAGDEVASPVGGPDARSPAGGDE
jgi:hypothetical protein